MNNQNEFNTMFLLELIDDDKIAKNLKQINYHLMEQEIDNLELIETIEDTRDIIKALPKMIEKGDLTHDKCILLSKNLVLIHQGLLSVSEQYDLSKGNNELSLSIQYLLRGLTSFYPTLAMLSASGGDQNGS
jgi:plasmid maintenance system antidote protein VapI